MNERHGMSKTPIYVAWVNMKTRCLNSNATRYEQWGGRGITICTRWLESFVNFFEDMGPSWEEGLQLDRIDGDCGYIAENCKWSTRSEQMKNRSRFQDRPEWQQKQSVAQKEAGLRYWNNMTSEERKAEVQRRRGMKVGQ